MGIPSPILPIRDDQPNGFFGLCDVSFVQQ